jgi:4-hydroxy-3-polyprenylbenzoate decarboxylase
MDPLQMDDHPSPGSGIAYDDLRGWIALAERLGEIRIVRGATWQEDMGLVAEAIVREDDGPCVIFEDVPGCTAGHRLLLNVFAGRRRNMTLGLPDHLDKWQLSDGFRKAYLERPRLIAHQIVNDGPVMENVLTGDAIDVTAFPAPIWHEQDGGRFIGTGTFSITRDPDDGWLNAGAYRAQIHDRTSVGVVMNSGHHGQIQRDKYFKSGKPLPIAMVLGGDPLAFFYGGTEVPAGTFELDVVSGLRGRPEKMIIGPVTGLPIPAAAEVVLEGFVRPGVVRWEGPFGEWTGYYASAASDQPVLEVKAIYHRDNPILLGVPPMGGGADEMARYRAVMRSAMVKQSLLAAGVGGISQVWCHEVGGSRLLHGVSLKQSHPGHAVQAGMVAAQCGSAVYASKYVIVVDDDIDVTDLNQLMWAMCTRTDPRRSIQFIDGSWDSPADPIMSPEQRAMGDMTHSVAVIDACRPYRWRDRFPAANAPSHEFAARAREKYGWLLRR